MNDKNEPRIDDEGKKHYTLKAETGHIGLELPDLKVDWKAHLSQFHQIVQIAQSLGKPPTFAVEAITNIDAAITILENQNVDLLDALKKLFEQPRNMEYWLDAENAMEKAEGKNE